MDLTIALGIAASFGFIALRMAASELCDWSPTLAKWIIAKAASLLPEHLCHQHWEEGDARVDGCPGRLTKLGFAISYYWACYVISHEYAHLTLRKEFAQRGISSISEITNRLERNEDSLAQSTIWKLNEFLRRREPQTLMTYETFARWAKEELELDEVEGTDENIQIVWNSLHEFVRRQNGES